MKEFRAYLASHFFNAAMFTWTEMMARKIEENTNLKLYVPQRNDSINDKKNNDEVITDIGISKADTAELKKANILIACLDGIAIDPGVSAEIMGYGLIKELEEEYGIKDFPRTIIGIITDMRYLGTGENKVYRNQMVIGKVKEHGYLVVGYPTSESYIEETIEIINKFIEENK